MADKTYAMAVDKDGRKNKVRGSERVMYTTHNPCWDAKNRFGLPPELPFDFAQVAAVLGGNAAPPSAQTAPVQSNPAPDPVPPAQEGFASLADEYVEIPSNAPAPSPEGIAPVLADLMRQNGVTEQEIRLAIGMRGYFPEDMPITQYPPDFVQGVLIGAWEQVFGMIQENRKVPF